MNTKVNTMLDHKIVDEISEKISKLIPDNLQNMRADIKKNCHALLESSLAKFALVTREEFDVQKQVLAKTRAKLEQVEKQLAALEQAQQHKSSTD
jgi:BMFP domain-containing protein YqiC